MRRPQKEVDALKQKVKDLVAKHPDMTASQIAEKVGISLPTAMKWMDGSPKKAKVVKIKAEKPAKKGKRGRPRKVKEPEPEAAPEETPEETPEEETEEKENAEDTAKAE